MRFYPVDPSVGYFAESPEAVGYFYEAPESLGCCNPVSQRVCPACGCHLGEAPETMGYFAEGPEVGYFADPPPGFVEGYGEIAPEVGYVYEAPESVGYYAEAPEMGYYGESPQVMGYGQPEMGNFAESREFAEAPLEMGGMYETPDSMSEAPDSMGYFAEDPGYGEVAPEMGYFAEDPMVSGYVREATTEFSPRVLPVDKIGEVEGYTRPKTINPSVNNFRPSEETSQASGQWFRPLW
ncbi:MAG: hypothetical protein ACREOI_07775 [bacterium]